MKKDNKIPVVNQYDMVSPATKLLEKRRKMYEIHEAFEVQKDQFHNQEMVFKNDEDKIKQKDRQLQEDLSKFCQFLQENQSKRKKAQERIKMEDKTYTEKIEQIKNLQKEIEELSISQKKYMKKIIHLKKYQEYLETVRTTYGDQYPQMSDILTRYQTLKKSNDDLIKHRDITQHNYQILKIESMAHEKQLNQSLLTINNQIKELSRRIQDKTHEKNQLQSEVERSNEQYSNKNLNLGKIFMAIDNLHYRCNQNSYKVKHQFDDKGTNTDKKQVKSKKIQTDITATVAKQQQQEQSTYQHRSKHATSKLKSILSHMKDLKIIIDDYRSTIKHGRQQKIDKY